MEEEFFLVHTATRAVEPAGSRTVARARETVGDLVSGEFHEGQLEVRTPPCDDAEELLRQLTAVRRAAYDASRAHGLGPVRRGNLRAASTARPARAVASSPDAAGKSVPESIGLPPPFLRQDMRCRAFAILGALSGRTPARPAVP